MLSTCLRYNMHDMYACRAFRVSSLCPQTSPTCLVSLAPNVKSTPSASCPRPPLQQWASSRTEETTDPTAARSCSKRCHTNEDIGIIAMTHSFTAHSVPSSCRHHGRDWCLYEAMVMKCCIARCSRMRKQEEPLRRNPRRAGWDCDWIYRLFSW